MRSIKDNLEFLDKWQNVLDDSEVALDIGDTELINESVGKLNEMERACDSFEVKQMLSR